MRSSKALAQIARPRLVLSERLIHIMRHSRDERAALLASEKILERAWGKPKAEDDTSNSIMKNMTPDEQKRYVAELLEFAASIEVPIEEDDGSRTAIDSSRAGGGRGRD